MEFGTAFDRKMIQILNEKAQFRCKEEYADHSHT